MEVENYYWIEIKSKTSFNKLKKNPQKSLTRKAFSCNCIKIIFDIKKIPSNYTESY